MKLPIVITLLILIPFYSTSQGTWVQKSDFPGGYRSEAVSFSIGGNGFVAGGMKNNSPPYIYYSDAYRYNPSSDGWEQIPDLPHAVTEGTSFTIGSKAFVITGRDSLGFNDDVLVWDTVTGHWSLGGTIPSPCKRIRAVGFSINDKGYITCGIDSSQTEILSDLWEYDASSGQWSQKSSCPGSVRYDASCFVVNGKAYLMTGTYGFGDLNDVWEYDPTSDYWTQKSSLPDSTLNAAVAFALGGFGYLTWGQHGFEFAFRRLYKYDPNTDVWTQKETFPDNPHLNGNSFVIGQAAWLTVGFVPLNPNSTWSYIPEPVGISDLMPGEIKVFPNPAIDNVTIVLEKNKGKERLTVELMDLHGRIRKSFRSVAGEEKIVLNVSDLPSGIYFIVVVSNDYTGHARLIISD